MNLGFYMIAHVLFYLRKELRKRDKLWVHIVCNIGY